MNNSRRSFLKYAGVAAAAVAATPVVRAVASSGGAAHGPEVGKLPTQKIAGRWAMVVDTRKLVKEADFEPLIEACHKVHNVPHLPDEKREEEIKWIWTDEFEHTFPEFMSRWPKGRVPTTLNKPYLLLCNHCEYPPCVRVCPTKATFQREDGIVLMDFHRCIGCRYCMAGCPYGARSFNFSDPRAYLPEEEINMEFPTRVQGVVEKCNFCAERLAKGLRPACVEASKGALLFGDLDDPSSEVSRAVRNNFVIRRKPELGTQPNVYYIV
ncbi:putative sulfite reductase-associated electron transfer protein DsrO [Desulfocurvibacter africanus PCS]|uniref:Putative sulfite reductase-associated electron transfer protein DsrO n=1 Tax=Desulfocurvibacter africanus PCS TaxID=1262666 RepID=M5PPF6_DESAF|nr:4Fe-4S dicluster domain-containing protein [Desulfocurvibacter africanus]EMG35864.1 putative sulfite reductase-associated electron transfer protein DsrO [Desulfocurvibacter africanus PCS]